MKAKIIFDSAVNKVKTVNINHEIMRLFGINSIMMDLSYFEF